jgi:hypothetical protein
MLELNMKFEYTSTINDAVETHIRLNQISGSLRKEFWGIAIIAPVVFFLIFIFTKGSFQSRLATPFIFTMIYLAFHKLTFEKRHRKSIRRILLKNMNNEEEIPAYYEFKKKSFCFGWEGQVLSFDWKNLKEVREDENNFELEMEPLALAIIPKRIFADLEAQSTILQEIKSHLK